MKLLISYETFQLGSKLELLLLHLDCARRFSFIDLNPLLGDTKLTTRIYETRNYPTTDSAR